MTKQEFIAGKLFTLGNGGTVYQFRESRSVSGISPGYIVQSDGTYYCSLELVTKAAARCYRHLFFKKCVFVLKFRDCVVLAPVQPVPADFRFVG